MYRTRKESQEPVNKTGKFERTRPEVAGSFEARWSEPRVQANVRSCGKWRSVLPVAFMRSRMPNGKQCAGAMREAFVDDPTCPLRQAAIRILEMPMVRSSKWNRRTSRTLEATGEGGNGAFRYASSVLSGNRSGIPRGARVARSVSRNGP